MTARMTATERQLDTADLTERVKGMYQEVALHPDHDFHFETGRPLAERLGYPAVELDRIPAAAINSFAGVGYFLDLAAIAPGEVVLDLGSGSGSDSFLAALAADQAGSVIGVDMTAEQLTKATDLAAGAGIANVEFREGQIEGPPVDPGSVDCVISNGVINLAGQARRLHRRGDGAAAGWATGDRRHRQRQTAPRGRHLRRLAVGGVHRRRHAARPVSGDDRGRRP
jgi:arsenite methyltransferase